MNKVKTINNKSALIAYCGLYCEDCGGYSQDIAKAAEKLEAQLEKYKYYLTVQAMFSEQFKNYEEFTKNLNFLTQMKCPIICTQRDHTECNVWHCCREKGFAGCYECNEFEHCENIKNALGEIFYNACITNLKNIKEMGVDNWIENGTRYWFSCDVD